jgi:HAD superfamily hydrolase (TIGR01509 family)
LSKVKAILFDLFGTLTYQENPVTNEEVSKHLCANGYDVSPQQFKAAFAFVAFVDYTRHGYRNWQSFLSRVFQRLRVNVHNKTLGDIVRLYESRPLKLYPDAIDALVEAKGAGFKTATVTTGASFIVKTAVKPIGQHLDFLITSYETGYDKSNPKMYQKALEILKVKPQEAVMIGDDPQLDVLIPKSLGMKTTLIDREEKNKSQSVDASVYNLNEAMETIIRQHGKN